MESTQELRYGEERISFWVRATETKLHQLFNKPHRQQVMRRLFRMKGVPGNYQLLSSYSPTNPVEPDDVDWPDTYLECIEVINSDGSTPDSVPAL